MEKIMKLHKLLLKLKHHMSIQENMYSLPLSHSFIPRDYRNKLNNVYSAAITKALKDNIDIVEYAYDKHCIILKLTIDKNSTMSLPSRNLTTWWLIEPASSVFSKSAYFKWVKIKSPNSMLSNNTWTRNTIVTKTQKYIPQVLFTGKILALGYPRRLLISNRFGASMLIGTSCNSGYPDYKELKDGICEYRFSILRNKNSNLKIDIGQKYNKVNLDDFLAAIMYTKQDNPVPVDIKVYSNSKDFQDRYITAIYIDDIPADIESLLRVQYVEDKLTNKEKLCAPQLLGTQSNSLSEIIFPD